MAVRAGPRWRREQEQRGAREGRGRRVLERRRNRGITLLLLDPKGYIVPPYIGGIP